MARVRVTVPVYGLHGGFPHREHRSKKGRRKLAIGQDKIATYFVRVKKDEKILNKREFMPTEPTEAPEFKETLTLEDVLEVPRTYKKQPATYPKLACENCGYHNQLNFVPKKDWGKLIDVVCQNCKEMAYWSYYWKEWEMGSLLFFMAQGQFRELIKQGVPLLSLR